MAGSNEVTGAPQLLAAGQQPGVDWVAAQRAYLLVTFAANLIWETAHLPLYTIWETGTRREIVFAVVHCTAGDLVIATVSLTLALIVGGSRFWPSGDHRRVAALTIFFGVSYTAFSEYVNLVVRQSWAYSELMPVLPILGTGISPLFQWIAVPFVALWAARRAASTAASSFPNPGSFGAGTWSGSAGLESVGIPPRSTRDSDNGAR